ncbi:MAG: 2-phospho-L-lactate guanylyltransferase [Ilumatobacter sp.]
MNLAVLVPVKAFSMAKGRLSGVLTPDERQRLARWLADRVVTAASAAPVFVVCDDEEVRTWATERGVSALWTAELGLNGAVDDGVASIAERGFEHVIVSHADLPLPSRLLGVARPHTATFVPDPNSDGTNVMSFPLQRPRAPHSPAGAFAAAYGLGSFVRHRDAATRAGLPVEVRIDVELSLDLDTPTDLTHPLLREVLPTWLPTIPVNPFTHRRTPPA